MKKIALLLTIPALLFSYSAVAQNVGINTSGAAPDDGAGLDINFNNKGVLFPRVNITNLNTIAPIIGSSTTSLLVYNTNASTGLGYHYWDGARWVRFATGGESWQITGNNNTNATNFLGTTNAQPLIFRTNNAERMRIQPNGRIGIRTNPNTLLHMSNGGTPVGAAAMADFINADNNGVSLSGYNTSTNNGFNGIEGVIEYNGTAAPAGVLGLHIYQGTLSSPGVGVLGATNEWQGIGVRGQRFNSGGPDTGYGGLFLNDLGYTGGVFNASDSILKRDVVEISNAISIIKNLRAVEYFYNTEEYPNMGLKAELDYGFIAQEVALEIPSIVKEKSLPTNALSKPLEKSSKNKDEFELFLTVDYTRVIPILTKAIQEQQTKIESLEQRIEALERAMED